MMTHEPAPPARRPSAPLWLLRATVGVGVALMLIGLFLGGLYYGQARNRTRVDELNRRVADLCAGTPDPVACVRAPATVIVNPPASPTVVTPPTTSASSSPSTTPRTSSSSVPTSRPGSTAAGSSATTVPPRSSTTSASPPRSSTTTTSTSTLLPPISLPPLLSASSRRHADGSTPALTVLLGADLAALGILKARRRCRYRRGHDRPRQHPQDPAAEGSRHS